MTDRPLSQILREILMAMSELLRSEINLAKVELAWSARRVSGQGARLAAGGVAAWLGVNCLVAFLVIGLGALFNNYWLSALLVGLVFAGAGAMLILGAVKKIRATPLKPTAIQGLQNDRALVTENASEAISPLRKAA